MNELRVSKCIFIGSQRLTSLADSYSARLTIHRSHILAFATGAAVIFFRAFFYVPDEAVAVLQFGAAVLALK
jgi:hypothetical protein